MLKENLNSAEGRFAPVGVEAGAEADQGRCREKGPDQKVAAVEEAIVIVVYCLEPRQKGEERDLAG